MARKKLSPYQKIVRAGERGSGLRLSPEDIDSLVMDDAITFRALLDDDPDLESSGRSESEITGGGDE